MTRATLEPMIEGGTGVLQLLLVPYHLTRLHGEFPGYPSLDEVRARGLAFPFRPGAQHRVVCLHGGMSPDELRAQVDLEPAGSAVASEWFRWHCYAFTPFGWAPWLIPTFTQGKLATIHFWRHGGGEMEQHAAMLRYVNGLFCEPEILPNHRWKLFERKDERVWGFVWGDVRLYYEPKDGLAELRVSWK